MVQDDAYTLSYFRAGETCCRRTPGLERDEVPRPGALLLTRKSARAAPEPGQTFLLLVGLAAVMPCSVASQLLLLLLPRRLAATLGGHRRWPAWKNSAGVRRPGLARPSTTQAGQAARRSSNLPGSCSWPGTSASTAVTGRARRSTGSCSRRRRASSRPNSRTATCWRRGDRRQSAGAEPPVDVLSNSLISYRTFPGARAVRRPRRGAAGGGQAVQRPAGGAAGDRGRAGESPRRPPPGGGGAGQPPDLAAAAPGVLRRGAGGTGSPRPEPEQHRPRTRWRCSSTDRPRPKTP